jgi:hypothetical protein
VRHPVGLLSSWAMPIAKGDWVLQAVVQESYGRLDFLYPVSLLKLHQAISLTIQHLRIVTVPFSSQILANQIEHGGEGAEEVVLLDVELKAYFVQCPKYAVDQLKYF